MAATDGIDDEHAVASLLDANHRRRGQHLDAAAGLGAFEQRAVDVGAMDDGVGIAESLPERVADGDAADQRFVKRVVHHHLVGEDGARAGPGAEVERVESGEGIRPELDASADLAERAGLLQHLDVEAAPSQCQRRGQTADTAAGNEDGKGGQRCLHAAIVR